MDSKEPKPNDLTRRDLLGLAGKAAEWGFVTAAGIQVAAPEVRREYRDRYKGLELEESISKRLADIQHDFGIRVNTDVKGLAVWVYGKTEKFEGVDSRSILDDYFTLLEEVLWTLPPDTLSMFVETITVAQSIGAGANGRAPSLAYFSEPRHRFMNLAIDKYLTGIVAIFHSLDRGTWASVSTQYRDVVYHEITHRLTTRKLLDNWPQGRHVAAYGKNDGPTEDIATFAEALFASRKLSVDTKKMDMLRTHLSGMLKLPEDYWHMIGSGPHAIEKWRSYWEKNGRLRKT